MMGLKNNFLILIFVITVNICYGQMVNIETKRMQTDSIRIAFKGDILFNYTSNNGEYVFSFSSGITTQFKSKDLNKIFFFVGNYALIRSEDQDFRNNWFFHLRFNQEITNLFRVEAFIQNQSNKLLVIDSRNLVGAGIRLKFISKENFRAYLGNSYMYEIEDSEETDITNYNHRHNSYLSFSTSLFNGKLDLINTIYFQPLYSEISNHRVLEQFKIEIPITKTLSFSGLYHYFYVSNTPALKSDKSSDVSFGISLNI